MCPSIPGKIPLPWACRAVWPDSSPWPGLLALGAMETSLVPNSHWASGYLSPALPGSLSTGSSFPSWSHPKKEFTWSGGVVLSRGWRLVENKIRRNDFAARPAPPRPAPPRARGRGFLLVRTWVRGGVCRIPGAGQWERRIDKAGV